MMRYSVESWAIKYVKYGFLSFPRKYKKRLLNTGPDSLRTASKKVVHKAGEFIGSKIADAVNKSNEEKTIVPPEKREEILNALRQLL